jgi:vacuolar iron transporter family protein
MNEAIKTGVSFGLTSGIITTLGLMIGLNTGTGLRLAVIGGILIIAVADAFSDALGIHISEESKKGNGHKAVWTATIFTFLTKLIIASSFLIAILLFELSLAIKINIIWGLVLLIIFNYILAKQKGEVVWKVIAEHVIIATIVITISYSLGKLVSIYFI